MGEAARLLVATTLLCGAVLAVASPGIAVRRSC
jgi:hypothetical protein